MTRLVRTFLLSAFTVLILGNVRLGAATKTVRLVLTSGSSFAVPPNIVNNLIHVTLVGAGGGGGGGAGGSAGMNGSGGGAGGSAGEYVSFPFDTTGVPNIPYSLGAGGSIGISGVGGSNGSAGGVGGDTYFGRSRAKGGTGGGGGVHKGVGGTPGATALGNADAGAGGDSGLAPLDPPKAGHNSNALLGFGIGGAAGTFVSPGTAGGGGGGGGAPSIIAAGGNGQAGQHADVNVFTNAIPPLASPGGLGAGGGGGGGARSNNDNRGGNGAPAGSGAIILLFDVQQ